MIAKFDGYRKFETPDLYLCSPGCKLNNGLLSNVSGVLDNIRDLEIIPTFNAPSQLNFRCYKPSGLIKKKIEKYAGEKVSFTGYGEPITDISASFSPVQNLNGYDSPWPNGGGKNKFDKTLVTTIHDGILNNDGTWSSSEYSGYTDPVIVVKPNTQYVMSGKITEWGNGKAAGYRVYYYDNGKNFISRSDNLRASENSSDAPFTTPSNCYYLALQCQRINNYPLLDTIQLELGSSATSWAPYSNICPIIGRSSVDIWDDPKYGGFIKWNQFFTKKNTSYNSGRLHVRCSSDGSITVTVDEGANLTQTSGNISWYSNTVTGGQKYATLNFGDAAVGIRIYFTTIGIGKQNNIYTQSTDSAWGNMRVACTATPAGTYVFKPMFCNLTTMFGEEVADYVYGLERETAGAGVAWFRNLFPHYWYDTSAATVTCVSAVNGNPYGLIQVSWQSEAGTVYSGNINLTTGILTVTGAYLSLNNSSWASFSSEGNTFFACTTTSSNLKTKRGVFLCTAFKTGHSQYFPTHPVAGTMYNVWARGYNINVYYPDCANLTEWNAFVANSDIGIFYELATPITYQLTGQRMSSFDGANNIWSDADSIDVSVLTYESTSGETQDIGAIAHQIKQYNAIKNRKMVYADGIGFFVITDLTDGYDNKASYKDVSAESCEVELQRTTLPYIQDGTYKFSTGSASSPGIIEILMAYAPLWTIGHIDTTVNNRYRTFQDVDFTKNILGFMLEDLQDAYECIFVFNIENRVIDIYDKSNYVRETDIHITKDDLITSLDIHESSDDLYTALRVEGDNDLTINAVNPIGTGILYNFDYYIDWMTPSLGAKVVAWRNLVSSYEDSYYNLQLSRFANITTRNMLDAEINKLNTELTMYTRCKENIVASASDEDIAAYNEIITGIGGTPIPETGYYLWVMYADDNIGTNITTDPYGKDYIGLAFDKSSEVASVDPLDYTWYTFRNGETFPRSVDGETKYTWIVYADSIVSGMSNNPDSKKYIGVAIDRDSQTKSSDYSAYSWSLIESGGIGLNETLSAIISLIEEAASELESVTAQRADLQITIAEQDEAVAVIHNALNMGSYFTTDEMDELSNYIIEGTYTDEYITTTENMTSSERFAQMKTLYDRAKDQLAKVSSPTQEFSVDAENFIFEQDFQRWSDQLETGCLINVETDDDDVAALFLTSFEVNYDDKKLSLTFGNRYNRFDAKALFERALGSISKTANTLSYMKDTIYPIESGEFDKMKEALETSRTLTKNAVLSSDNEQVIIDDTGYTGRRILPDGSIDPKQIKINGRNIVFTDDEWETCKTAIGELILSGGISAYGVNAEVLLGDMIIGQELHIINEDGEDMFQVMSNQIVSTVSANLDENYYSKGYLDANYITGDKVDERISNAYSQVSQEVDNITATFGTYMEDASQAQSDTNDQINLINSYIRLTSDGIILGRSDSTITLKIQNNRIGIYNGDNEITYWTTSDFVSPKTLSIPKGTGRLNMGDFAFIPRDNGSLDFTWVGD